MNTRKLTSLTLLICLAMGMSDFISVAPAGQNVVVVLDDSGSMRDRMRKAGRRIRKMDAAKEALVTVLQQLPDDAKVGVVLLNGRIQKQPWLIELGPVDIQSTRQAISQVRANGATPLGQFMKVAADALLDLRSKEHYGNYRLLIVTDGEAGDGHLVESYLPDIMARGMTVDVIGVDMESDHSLATKVHSYRRADNPESLTQAIREVFAETTSAGDAGESDFELLEGFPMECASAALTALSDISKFRIGEDPEMNRNSERSSYLDRSGSNRPASGTGTGTGTVVSQRRKSSLPSIIAMFVIFLALSNILRAAFKNKH